MKNDDLVVIRLAEEKDYENVLALMQGIHALHVSNRPDIYLDTLDCYPHSVFIEEMKNRNLLVADVEGNVVGLISFYEKRQNSPVHVPRQVLYINIVGVAEGFRGRGIGHALFQEVRALATEKGFDAMELDVNAWNDDALSMYENLGFKEDWRRMSLNIR